MIRTLFAFIVGAACTAIIFVGYVVPSVRASWHAQRFNDGHISARLEISEKLQKEFPEAPINCKEVRPLFEVKTTTVYVAECQNEKRIKVVR